MERYLLLIASLLPLLVGPIIARRAAQSVVARAFLSRFVVVALGGIILFHIWPLAFLKVGWLALVSGLSGLAGPFFFHGVLHKHEERASLALVWVAFLGLAIHATIDGVALFGPGEHLESATALAKSDSVPLLALAVLLHRLPMALAIWWLVGPVLGRRVAVGLLLGIAFSTLLGFLVADRVMEGISGPGIAVFEAGVAGMLLHVIFGHGPHNRKSVSQHRGAALAGAAGGLVTLAALFVTHPPEYLYGGPAGTSPLGLGWPLGPVLLTVYGLGALLLTLHRSHSKTSTRQQTM